MKFLKTKSIKFISFILFFAVFLFSAQILHNVVYSDEYDDLTKKIADLQTALASSKNATKPLQTQLTGLKSQLAAIDSQVAQIEKDLLKKKKDIDEGYKKLSDKQKLFNVTVKNSYIKTYTFSPLLIFLSGGNVSDITSMLTYQKRNTEQDKNIITNIALLLVDLEQKKADLESSQQRLAAAKVSLDKDRAEVQKVVDGAVAYQSSLSGQIAELSAKQQAILSQRLGALNIPRSAGTSARGCSDDRGVDPGFSPRIAFFTYGAPHRNGLNQYGAWGRAKDGQNEDQILSAYYPSMSLKRDYDQGIQISTTTGWSGSIEDYVKRIYEVPDSWTENNMAVLKSQAVAARTYALNVTGNGSKQICTSEQCQVFKPEPKGGNWEQAVNATAGWVLMDGGSPGFTQYASTHGGYISNLSKFDGRVGNPASFSELNERAYDKESPWFYCDWGSRGDKKTAWLNPSEVADIANVLMLASKDSSITEHLYQPDKPNPAGTDTWDPQRVKQELSNRGGTPFNSVSDVSVSWDTGSGKTTQVTVNGDAGSQSFSGSDFKTYFNLRAPANIQIVGPLFNVEKQ